METVTDLELILYLDFHEEVPCESEYCKIDLGKGAHAADWYVRFDECNELLTWCNERFMVYSKDEMLGIPTYCARHGKVTKMLSWHPIRVS